MTETHTSAEARWAPGATPETPEDWRALQRALAAPFAAWEVGFRPQGKASEKDHKAAVVAYIDRQAVITRLNDVVGLGNWAFDWEPVPSAPGDKKVAARGALSIFGVSHADVGDADMGGFSGEWQKERVSDLLKRCAVHKGVGLYLAYIKCPRCPTGQNGLEDGVEDALRWALAAGHLWVSAEAAARFGAEAAEPFQWWNGLQSAYNAAKGQQNAQQNAKQSRAQQTTQATQTTQRQRSQVAQAAQAGETTEETVASEQQMAALRKLAIALGHEEPKSMSAASARQRIAQWSAEYQRRQPPRQPPRQAQRAS